MTVLLFVLFTILVGITVEYLLRRRRESDTGLSEAKKSLSLSKIMNMLPGGVFLQPTFTWSKILDSGHILIGIHPVLLGLVGEPDGLDILPESKKIKIGESLLKIQKDSKMLQIKAPVAGEITAVNQNFKETPLEKLGATWLYTMKPEKISQEVNNWFIAEKSSEWLREKFQLMTDFFMQSLSKEKLGLTMTDGGEIPIGVLSQFDQKIWHDFEKKFC
jgi:glycine cleavage system H lipoate-binding protein